MTTPIATRYSKEFVAGWGAMDFNGHLANTAYLDLAADARMAFFADHGFPPKQFRQLGIGPVMRKDEIEYFREIHLHEVVVVTSAAAGMSPDGSRYVLENEIWSAAGVRAAQIRSTGGWLDLELRRLVAAPAPLLTALVAMPRTSGFREMPPLVAGPGTGASPTRAAP
jgi:acyl-CoA thioester hydrolase